LKINLSTTISKKPSCHELSIDMVIHEGIFKNTVEIVYNETGYNEQPDITSRFGAEVRSRRCTYMIIAISVITRTGYNEKIRLDLGARYILYPISYYYTVFDFYCYPIALFPVLPSFLKTAVNFLCDRLVLYVLTSLVLGFVSSNKVKTGISLSGT